MDSTDLWNLFHIELIIFSVDNGQKHLKIEIEILPDPIFCKNETQTPEEKDPFAEINHFFTNYPKHLLPMKEEFRDIFQKIKNNESVDVELARTHETLVNLFKDDNELNLKVRIFLDNLSPVLRKPDIEQRYRLNYLINKFNIPDFDLMARGLGPEFT